MLVTKKRDMREMDVTKGVLISRDSELKRANRKLRRSLFLAERYKPI